METDLKGTLQRLVELADDKKREMENILELTHRQSEALTDEETEDPDDLSKLIDQKQKHIETINKLDEEFTSLYDSVKPYLTEDLRQGENIGAYIVFKQLQGIIRDIYLTMEKTRVLEEENSEKALQLMENLKKNIREVSAGKKGLSAYNQQPILSDGTFFDKKK